MLAQDLDLFQNILGERAPFKRVFQNKWSVRSLPLRHAIGCTSLKVSWVKSVINQRPLQVVATSSYHRTTGQQCVSTCLRVDFPVWSRSEKEAFFCPWPHDEHVTGEQFFCRLVLGIASFRHQKLRQRPHFSCVLSFLSPEERRLFESGRRRKSPPVQQVQYRTHRNYMYCTVFGPSFKVCLFPLHFIWLGLGITAPTGSTPCA